MIPLSCKETVSYTDNDGIVYTFKPKTGALEKEFFSLYDDREQAEASTWLGKVEVFLHKILVSVADPQKRFDGVPDYNTREQQEILSFWSKANELTPEEKKS